MFPPNPPPTPTISELIDALTHILEVLGRGVKALGWSVATLDAYIETSTYKGWLYNISKLVPKFVGEIDPIQHAKLFE